MLLPGCACGPDLHQASLKARCACSERARRLPYRGFKPTENTMTSIRHLSIAVCIAAVSTLSFAQNTGTRTTPDSTVGVDPADARQAMDAAQRRDAEAAVIRTDESAAQRARDAADNTRDGAAAVGNRASNAARNTVDGDRNVGGRAPRADRN